MKLNTMTNKILIRNLRTKVAHMKTIKAKHKAEYEPIADLVTYRAMPTRRRPLKKTITVYFFKNPIVSRDKLAELQAEKGNIPNFPFGDAVKIPAAWLIEKSGLKKGFTLGNAGISSNHTLAIINRGGSSAGYILLLKDEIQRTVAEKFGITPGPEPVFGGF